MLSLAIMCLGVIGYQGGDGLSKKLENQLKDLKALGVNVSILKDGLDVSVIDAVTDRLIDKLLELPKVRILSFGVESTPSQAQLLRISSMTDLRVFEMSRRSGDPGEALRFVKDLPLLEEVICNTTDIGVRHLKLAPWLKRLDLGYSPITNNSMKEIGQIKGLNRLRACFKR